MIPDELQFQPGRVEPDAGRAAGVTGAAEARHRPVRVASRSRRAATSPGPAAARAAARERRLHVAAGRAVRVGPGRARQVRPVPCAGGHEVCGVDGAVTGAPE